VKDGIREFLQRNATREFMRAHVAGLKEAYSVSVDTTRILELELHKKS